MTHAVREFAVDALIREAHRTSGSIGGDDVLEMTFVGNPIMHHLLLGISPVELGTAPFALATDGPTTLGAQRTRPRGESRRARLRAALYRRPRRSRHRGRAAGRGTLGRRHGDAAGRRRDQRRDRPQRARASARCIEPDGSGLRGRPDLLWPTRSRARRDRARAHRPGDARAALPRDRLRVRGPTSPASPPRWSASASPDCVAPASSRRSPSSSWRV